MEDQNSWKGHTFTLMIFGGIVVLCSIFFVLGMLVGRMQGLKLATLAAAEAEAKTPPKEMREDRPVIKLPDAVDNDRLSANKPAPAETPVVSDTPARAPKPERADTKPDVSPAGSVMSLQIAALKKQADAERQLGELKSKGFGRAFILSPAPTDSSPLYRVQIAVSDSVEAASVKQKLESAGYKPILKQ